jgi:lipoate-protein ligase A
MDQWRLITSFPAVGSWNMALDEALLLSAARKVELPALRLYSWEPATLSLGYAQHSSDVDRESLERSGWGLVRRPTGGRAILHTDELTYSITAPADDPVMGGSLLESYHRVSQALLAALANLGITASADSVYAPELTANKFDPVCFEVPSNYEITVHGKKLIGSAQARKNNGVLQHGSLPLFGDLTRITSVLRYENDEKRDHAVTSLLGHAGTVTSLAGKSISLEQAQQAFINGFAQALKIEFIPSAPTQAELNHAGELQRTKYANDDWNLRL